MSDDLRKRAQLYADAQSNLELADRKAAEAKGFAQQARAQRDACEQALRSFVGPNVPRKLVMVNETKAVLIQTDPVKEVTYVSIEAVI